VNNILLFCFVTAGKQATETRGRQTGNRQKQKEEGRERSGVGGCCETVVRSFWLESESKIGHIQVALHDPPDRLFLFSLLDTCNNARIAKTLRDVLRFIQALFDQTKVHTPEQFNKLQARQLHTMNYIKTSTY
jgi:hypothetical protein